MECSKLTQTSCLIQTRANWVNPPPSWNFAFKSQLKVEESSCTIAPPGASPQNLFIHQKRALVALCFIFSHKTCKKGQINRLKQDNRSRLNHVLLPYAALLNSGHIWQIACLKEGNQDLSLSLIFICRRDRQGPGDLLLNKVSLIQLCSRHLVNPKLLQLEAGLQDRLLNIWRMGWWLHTNKNMLNMLQAGLLTAEIHRWLQRG